MTARDAMLQRTLRFASRMLILTFSVLDAAVTNLFDKLRELSREDPGWSLSSQECRLARRAGRVPHQTA